MGGVIALQLALLMPIQVNGITLLSSLPPDGLHMKTPITDLKDTEGYGYKKTLYDMAQNLDEKKYQEFCKSFSVTPSEESFKNLVVLKR